MHRSPLALVLLTLLALPAQAQFPIEETFTGPAAPGWVLARDAKLTAGDEDPTGEGWLRLTGNAEYRRGYAFLDTPFPSTEGVVADIEFAI